MHLVLPFASARSDGALAALPRLQLPCLSQLLARMAPVQTPGPADTPDENDELSLSPPHERLLAQAHGWPANDGLLPLARLWALADGLPAPVEPGLGWGLVQPTHWHLGTEQVSLADPAGLQLGEADSRALFNSVQPLFEELGWRLLWGAPTRWYACHALLTQLPTASIDRVIGRNVDWWLDAHPGARAALRPVRRLQAEVQMLLHQHPTNAAREAQGLLSVNSFWLSGTGVSAETATQPGLTLDDRLRQPALAEDWDAWLAAWQALDAGPLQQAWQALQAGDPTLRLSLCGEQRALTLAPRPLAWWQRGPLAPRPVAPASVLTGL